MTFTPAPPRSVFDPAVCEAWTRELAAYRRRGGHLANGLVAAGIVLIAMSFFTPWPWLKVVGLVCVGASVVPRLLAQRSLRCPHCQQPPTLPGTSTRVEVESLLACQRCSYWLRAPY